MSYVSKEKLFTKEWFRVWTLITVGAFILASGFVFFIDPHRIAPGGVYGIGIIVHYLTKGMFSWAPEGFPIGTVGLILNIPLTIIGIKLLGPRFGVKTVIGFILTSIFIDAQHYLFGYEPLVDDALLSSIFGGVLIGFGLGLIFKSKATSGGSDIIAMIIAKYTRLPLGQLMIYVDSAIVLIALAAFQDWKIPLYSWIVIYITGKVIDMTIQGVSYDKTLFIISDKYDEIRDKLIVDLDRGGTLINAVGMYKGQEKKIIFTNVSRREVHMLRDFIEQIDPRAFITVIDANEILGNGFKPIKED
ncbi:YitT family protein [Perlabentimonas gracilis]|uniref:YitT family protein n=1 Tax=Perlabentimonas gracilis TaxID=2715279 RepID=UPI00140B23C2|nr:YitT family protein [Perlabentimonas gracilis]NHB68051.1 YitT family protein [Perlabentimonas gracilis]